MVASEHFWEDQRRFILQHILQLFWVQSKKIWRFDLTSSFPVIATALSFPHFFEYRTHRLENGNIVFEEDGLYKDFYYKLIFYSIIDPALRWKGLWLLFRLKKIIMSVLRITFPILIISFTNVRLLCLIRNDGKDKPFHNYHHEHHQVSSNNLCHLTILSSSAPCVHPTRHRLYLHPLQCPPRRPHRRRHDPLQRPQGLHRLQAWG